LCGEVEERIDMKTPLCFFPALLSSFVLQKWTTTCKIHTHQLNPNKWKMDHQIMRPLIE
jgi:hypothetical protein